jgi:hypothetical protein
MNQDFQNKPNSQINITLFDNENECLNQASNFEIEFKTIKPISSK